MVSDTGWFASRLEMALTPDIAGPPVPELRDVPWGYRTAPWGYRTTPWGYCAAPSPSPAGCCSSTLPTEHPGPPAALRARTRDSHGADPVPFPIGLSCFPRTVALGAGGRHQS